MSKNYNRSREKEYEAVRQLEDIGYFAQRGAGSHKVDVIASNQNGFRMIMIYRCKRENFSKAKVEEDKAKLRKIPAPENCIKEVWIWIDGVGFEFKEIID